MKYVSRAGEKLEFALEEFKLEVKDTVCADLGCSTGGFTDCLIQHQAAKVYAVDTGYGVLDWKLRQKSQVVVKERTNALHVILPELVDFVSIDVGWTRQKLILPHALTLVKEGGNIISLLKPHYELNQAYLSEGEAEVAAQDTVAQLTQQGITVRQMVQSPVKGEKAGNTEYLLWVTK
ncbi:MAG: SAM-dependent methyltransferase [bacterium]|nr:SAM-dependent methyltransferase [bacterium]